jgi:SAM-dependent methyltransferase
MPKTMTADHGYDAELVRHNEVLRRACNIRSSDYVLDIGCGSGHTTRQAARTAAAGTAFGVDISEAAIARARELAHAENLRNVSFEHADAETYRFAPGHFDVAISRFGTMFFADPTAAFANIRQTLRPKGRLVMMLWQAPEHNEWDVALRQALGTTDTTPVGPDPFSLAEPAAVTAILTVAGFTDITFDDVREPVYYGPDVDTALDWARTFTCTSSALAQLDSDAAARTVLRLRKTLATHLRDDGVWFDSRAWLVTARRS